MATPKIHTRNELAKINRNRLQEMYNNLRKKHKELENKYERLVHFAIDTAFSDWNNDVELLLRELHKQNKVGIEGNSWVNLEDRETRDNILRIKAIKE